MIYNKFSRRYFLQGLGVSLCLPFLPSVMSRAYAATTGPKRYIQLMGAGGHFTDQFFAADTGFVQQNGIYVKALNSISGDVSPLIASEFSNYKNKFSLLRGLSVPCSHYPGSSDPNHNTTLPTCASSAIDGDDGTAPFPYSIDAILSESNKVYSTPISGVVKHVNFAPMAGDWGNFSWNVINGQAQRLPVTMTTSGLLAKFPSLTGGGTAPSPGDPVRTRNLGVLNGVFADYKRLRDSSAISSDDKMRLDSYLTLIEDVQKGLQDTQNPPTMACSKPAQESEANNDAKIRNAINILVAAMACDLTRVGAISFATPYEPLHSLSHQTVSNFKAGMLNVQRPWAQHVAYLLAKMDSIVEGGQTMLDNSIVYWGNEYGENLAKGEGEAHYPRNMNVFIAGGAGGALQMGYQVDYRKTGGLPLNKLMVSLLNAMGLASADYQRAGSVGFGEYNSTGVNNLKFQSFTSAAEKRAPLPFFYKGTALG